MTTKAYAAQSAKSPLAPYTIERRALGSKDVFIDILYCGVCHSDIHTARGEWPGVKFPSVPGHEIIGKVREVGSGVKNHKPGDIVGVGCLVDSCRTCSACRDNLENYCEGPVGAIGTYNGPFGGEGPNTYGGYSANIVVTEDFVLKIRHSENQLPAVAPLLCAGITTYSPLRHWKVGPGKRVGIVGIGGLGHMGIQLAKAMGAYVVAFTTSKSKVESAKELGADEVIISTDKAAMAANPKSLDFILDTVAAVHDLNEYLNLLKRDGTMTLICPADPEPSPQISTLIFGRRSIAGSLIGGIAETQEMLDFCASKEIVAKIEQIPMKDINIAYERMIKGDVKYRFVIDMATL